MEHNKSYCICRLWSINSSSSIGDSNVGKVYYGTFYSPSKNTTYTIDVGFCPDGLIILPDLNNTNSNKGFYSIINGTVMNKNWNGGSGYNATVALTSNGFTYTTGNDTSGAESIGGPNHTFVAVQFK